MPAAIYIETHGGAGVGGSDDHAGVDIGRTWTETPPASTPEELLRRLRRGDAVARGAQGSAAKWAHAAMALAVRALGRGDGCEAPDPRVVLRIVERVMSHGDARSGAIAVDLCPGDARALLRAWLGSLELGTSEAELLAWMQEDRFAHADLFRRLPRARAQAARRGRAGGRGGRRPRRRCAGGSRAGLLGVHPRDPVRARRRLPRAREGQAPGTRAGAAPRRARRGRREQHARRHAHARRAARARRARLRGRGDRDRSQGRPAPACRSRGRRAFLRWPSRRGAEPSRRRRGASGGALRPRTSLLPRPGWGRGRAHRSDHGRAAGGVPSHGARCLRRAALRRRAAAGGDGHGAGRALRPVPDRPLAERGGRRVAAGAGRPGRAHRPLGARRRPAALRPRAARTGFTPRGAERAVRGQAHHREGASSCSRTRSLLRAPPTRASIWCSSAAARRRRC
jgi:hypothetical protein